MAKWIVAGCWLFSFSRFVVEDGRVVFPPGEQASVWATDREDYGRT